MDPISPRIAQPSRGPRAPHDRRLKPSPDAQSAPRTGTRLAGARLVGALALALALVGCTSADGDRTATGLYRLMNMERNPTMQRAEQLSQFSVVPASRAMIHAPSALIVLERDVAGTIEQRIVLPNDSAIPGDNVLHLRGQADGNARNEFNFNEIAARFGGMPLPFQRLDANALMSGNDNLGSYSYARENVGVSTTCVLVVRRLTSVSRPLPRGARALDMVMRNCVVGTVEQALAPMSAQALGVSAAPQGAIYNLSPFAAPTQ